MMKSWSLKDGPRRREWQNRQPINEPGEQRPEGVIEQEQLDAAREWLRHVEAGRIGRTTPN